MCHVLAIFYFVLYVILTAFSIYSDTSHHHPIWLSSLEIICRGMAAFCMLLYILRFRPKTLSILWKSVPIAIFAFDLFYFYYELFISSSSQESLFDLTGIITIGLIILFPSWFLCFRFGYLKEINNRFKELGLKKALFLTLVVFIIGLVIGFVGTLDYFGHTTATLMLLNQEMEIVEFEGSTVDAYYNQPTEVAIWALENYINTLNRVKEEHALADTEKPYILFSPDRSLALSHARLVLLYKKLNDPEKCKYHFEMATSQTKGINLSAFDTEEKLIEFIHKLNSGTGKNNNSPNKTVP